MVFYSLIIIVIIIMMNIYFNSELFFKMNVLLFINIVCLSYICWNVHWKIISGDDAVETTLPFAGSSLFNVAFRSGRSRRFFGQNSCRSRFLFWRLLNIRGCVSFWNNSFFYYYLSNKSKQSEMKCKMKCSLWWRDGALRSFSHLISLLVSLALVVGAFAQRQPSL